MDDACTRLVSFLSPSGPWAIVTVLTSVFAVVFAITLARRNYAREVKRKSTILVTGAASGVGLELACELVRRRRSCVARVVLVDQYAALLEKAVARVESERVDPTIDVLSCVCDVSCQGEVFEMARRLHARLDSLEPSGAYVDVVVSNAGVVFGDASALGPDWFENDCETLDVSHERECERVRRTLAVNQEAHFWLSRAFVGRMARKNSGHFVTVASVAGLGGLPHLGAYASSKAGAAVFTESLRQDLRTVRATHVDVTLVCPYYIRTSLFAGVDVSNWLARLVCGEPLAPEYVAQKIANVIERPNAWSSVLLIPSRFVGLFLLRLFPSVVYDLAVSLMGVDHAMDSFAGRGDSFGLGRER